MLPSTLKDELINIVTKERYLDRPEELACYSYDSFLDESLPDAVIFPLTTREVSDILKTASRHQCTGYGQRCRYQCLRSSRSGTSRHCSLLFKNEQDHRGQYQGPLRYS